MPEVHPQAPRDGAVTTVSQNVWQLSAMIGPPVQGMRRWRWHCSTLIYGELCVIDEHEWPNFVLPKDLRDSRTPLALRPPTCSVLRWQCPLTAPFQTHDLEKPRRCYPDVIPAANRVGARVSRRLHTCMS
jgi:hypothetical protein